MVWRGSFSGRRGRNERRYDGAGRHCGRADNFFAAKGAYAKAEKTREESEKLKAEIVKLTEVKAQTQDQLEAVTRYHGIIEKLSSDYTRKAAELIAVLYPHGVLSRLKQRVLKVFGRAYFSEVQLSAFNELRVVTDAFLEAFTAQGLGV